MKKVEYKKYQDRSDSNRPYVNDLQKKLMEKYQLEYFRQYPFEDEFNRRSGVSFKRWAVSRDENIAPAMRNDSSQSAVSNLGLKPYHKSVSLQTRPVV